jgi:hypothetical protein
MGTELRDRIAEMLKASFGGDRSAAGRYAANIRWQNQGDGDKTTGSSGFREVSNDEHKALLKEANARKKQLAQNGTLTGDEQRSLGLWGTSAHSQMNEVLRFPDLDVDERNWVPEDFPPYDAANALVSAFDKVAAPIEENIVVYRGVAYDDELEFSDDAEPGRTIADRGFVATSINADEARSYGDGSRVDAFMEIRIPKGTNVWVPQTAYVDQEREILLPPDTEMRVIEVKSIEDRYGEARVYVLEVQR